MKHSLELTVTNNNSPAPSLSISMYSGVSDRRMDSLAGDRETNETRGKDMRLYAGGDIYMRARMRVARFRHTRRV